MTERERRPIESLGELIRIENCGPEQVSCLRCGVVLRVIGGGHFSGLREDGTRWTGGRDWLECKACIQWFVRVYSSFRLDQPPRGWEACDPPQFL
jgi:hypothetical protein